MRSLISAFCYSLPGDYYSQFCYTLSFKFMPLLSVAEQADLSFTWLKTSMVGSLAMGPI